jgi:serine/threonine protein kinase
MAGDSAYRDGKWAGGLPAGSRVGAYRIQAQTGAGGMAVVYRAHDERLGRTVALKVLAPALAADATFRQRFIRESRAAAAVDHPHILPVYEADDANGLLYIAMRFVSGGDLQSLAAREGRLPAARAAGFIAAAASALDAAHAAGLVHRDVKPANMLVDSQPGQPDHLYLSDFGLTKGVELASVTAPSEVFGTPDYISPEMAAGATVDGRADQYGLACTAFNLLAGVPVFQRDHSVALLLAHMSQPPPSLNALRPDLPPAAGQVLARALAKDPDDRYPSCGIFAAALAGALDAASHSTAAVTPGPPPAQALKQDRAYQTAVMTPWTDSRGWRVRAQHAEPDSVVVSQKAASAQESTAGVGSQRPRRRSTLLISAAAVIVLVGALVTGVVLVSNSHRPGSRHIASGAPSPVGGLVLGTRGSARGNQSGKAQKRSRAAASLSPSSPASLSPRSPASLSPRSPAGPVSQPPAAAVTVGGAGPSPDGAVASLASRLSWDQTVSGSSPALLVEVAVGEVPDTGMTASVTDNGAAMTSLAMVQDDGQPGGFLEVFGMAGVPEGANTIRVKVAGGPAQDLTGGSVFFDGAAARGAFSAPATATGYSTAPAVTIASTSGGLVAAFSACGSTIESTASPASQEFLADLDDDTGAGNSAGAISAATGGRVTVAWSAVSDYWGAIAVQVNN